MGQQENRRWVAVNISQFLDKLDVIGLRRWVRTTKYRYHGLKFRHLLKKNSTLKNIHSGEKVVIMGTGVSLLEAEMGAPRNCITFACNEIFQHPDAGKQKIDYYIVGEPYYGQILGKKYIHDISKFYSEIEQFFSSKNTALIYHATLREFLKKTGILAKQEIFYYASRNKMQESTTQVHDLEKPITLTDGAIYLMIAAAIYIGASEIYLLGCGYSYDPMQLLHFYDAESRPETLSEEEAKQFEDNLRKRYPEFSVVKYIRKNGRQYYNLLKTASDDAYEKYRIVKDHADKYGVKIINVIPGGFKSPVFDSVSYQEFIEFSKEW